MTFDVIQVDPNPYSGTLLAAALWVIPAVLVAIRSQVSAAHLRERLLVACVLVAAGAVLPTLCALNLIWWSSDLMAAGLFGYVTCLAFAILAFVWLGAASRRHALSSGRGGVA